MTHPTRTLIAGLLLCACSESTAGEQDAAVPEATTPSTVQAPDATTDGQPPANQTPTGVPSSGANPDPETDADDDPMSEPTNVNGQPPNGGPPEPEMPAAPSSNPNPMPNGGAGPADDVPDPPDGTGGAPDSEPEPNSEPEPDGSGTGDMPPQTTATCDDGPLELPLDGCAPEFEESGDFYADCVARINQLRWECQCLPPLERWTEAESCADAQAEYDYELDQAHAGISDGICEPGGGSQNECPGYGPRFGIVDYCLQQMWDEGPGEDFQAHGHYINMSSTGVSKVACGRFETPDGEIWSVQNFSR